MTKETRLEEKYSTGPLRLTLLCKDVSIAERVFDSLQLDQWRPVGTERQLGSWDSGLLYDCGDDNKTLVLTRTLDLVLRWSDDKATGAGVLRELMDLLKNAVHVSNVAKVEYSRTVSLDLGIRTSQMDQPSLQLWMDRIEKELVTSGIPVSATIVGGGITFSPKSRRWVEQWESVVNA